MTEQPRQFTEEDIAPLAASVKAPDSLHRRIGAMIAEDAGDARRGARSRRSRLRTARRPYLGGLRAGVATAVALALTTVALAVGLSQIALHPSGGQRLNVQQTTALALSGATRPAPQENPRDRSQLQVGVDGVSFPYWKERFGWRSTGTRTDMLGAHTVTTVFYVNSDGRRIGYAIASGLAPRTEGGTVVRRWGVSYRVLAYGGATVVTWQRDGHLCVMAGRGVSSHTLVNLASWSSEKSHTA